MNLMKYLIAVCVMVINCRIAKTTDPSAEKGKQKCDDCSTSTHDGSDPEKSREMSKLYEKYVQIKTLDLTTEFPNHKHKIDKWLIQLGWNKKTFKLSRDLFYDLMEIVNPSLEDLRELNKPRCRSTSTQNLPLSEKSQEISKLFEKFSKMKSLTLTREFPNHQIKIYNWMQIKGKGKSFDLSKPLFDDLMEYINPSLEELRELNEPEGSTSDLPLSEKSIEIQKIWQKNIELKGIYLPTLLPGHKNRITEWMRKRSYDKVGSLQITSTTFNDLMEFLDLSLEELRDLYERLETNPREPQPPQQQRLKID